MGADHQRDHEKLGTFSPAPSSGEGRGLGVELMICPACVRCSVNISKLWAWGRVFAGKSICVPGGWRGTKRLCKDRGSYTWVLSGRLPVHFTGRSLLYVCPSLCYVLSCQRRTGTFLSSVSCSGKLIDPERRGSCKLVYSRQSEHR